MPVVLFGWSLISVSWSLLATLVIGVILRFVGIYQWIYQLWLQCSTWFLNLILSSILVWWFHLPSVTITVEEFGFCSVKGVKIKWIDDPGVSIDEVTFQIDWEPNNIRNMTLVFHVKKARKELFSSLKDAKMESSTSFTLHWKVHSAGDLMSSNVRNSSETIPKAFHLLYVTDLEIGTTLYLQTGESFVSLLEAATLSGLLIPTEQATTFILKGMEATYCCGCYDVGFIQARQEKTLTMSLFDFEATWSSQGPARFTICNHNVQLSLNPRKVNYALLFLNHLWLQVVDRSEGAEQSNDSKDAGNANKSVEVSVTAENCKMCLCLQDGQEVINASLSFNLNSQLRNQKTQYTAAVGVQAVVPSTHQVEVPCASLANEMISAPWMCTFLGSHVTGNCTVARVFSDQSLCVVLRSESVAALTTFYQEYSSSLDGAEISDLCTWITSESKQQNPQLQVSLDFKGVRLCLQMDLFEEILNVTLEDLKGDVSRDQHNLMCDMSLKDFEVEDCVSEMFAVQQLRRSNEDISRPVLFFSFLQDEVVKVIKKLHTRLGELSVSVEEALLLKLLQFGGVKDKAQLWGEEARNDEDSLAISSFPSLLTVQPCFFEKIEFEPFLVTVKCSPAKQLSEEQLLLKSRLAIPSGFPPLMEKTSVQFGEFLRTWISYRTWLAFFRDVRRHYLKEIGRHSGSLLGSLHLLGNLSSLHEGIADGLTDLRETGDYIEFVKHVRGGLAESYYKFTDSWSACIKKSATKNDKIPSPSCSSSVNDAGSSMNSVRGVVESLTSYIFSPSSDSSQRELQRSNEPRKKLPAWPPNSPRRVRGSRGVMLTDSEDHDSSESEGSSVSGIKLADDWELVHRDAQRLLKGQEFLRRLQVSLTGEPNEEERFVSCLKLRYRNPEDMLNALVTTQNVYFMKVGSPTSDHVVLSIKLVDLYKARYKLQDEEHLLELLMKISGGRRLSLPSPDPADSPMVRCASGKVAQKAAKVINDARKRSEQKSS